MALIDGTGIVNASDALRLRWEGNQWTLHDEDYSTLVWQEGNKDPKPTEEEVNAGIASLQAEYDAQEYARKRQAEYPATKDFMEAYTEKEIGGDSTKWDAYIINYNKVRTENPK
ncbi:MAG: hypothetical protein QF535_16550 [Anaerolineales bacterium]|jgi:hypothetical protein|nr:hypothetical protein [Anaerolineales bacterium]